MNVNKSKLQAINRSLCVRDKITPGKHSIGTRFASTEPRNIDAHMIRQTPLSLHARGWGWQSGTSMTTSHNNDKRGRRRTMLLSISSKTCSSYLPPAKQQCTLDSSSIAEPASSKRAQEKRTGVISLLIPGQEEHLFLPYKGRWLPPPRTTLV